MAISFRDSQKLGPIRLTESRAGISWSIGLGKHVRFTRHAGGRWTHGVNVFGWRKTTRL
ncbi:DUF4236 domain-containing protein [Tsukamurella sp. 8F]|uniref:DUF4236 domain-containing protein n=1 Tax=unclassified Tsukamurella TaxID=2633480 RepID=UPI0023BA276C|nr:MULTISPECIES: DUF4236 domain-containing protein [unclassified Tsukamurella]MDF0531118.1 DUF4236 domain-containing protein [Tsukamurella sp. 8J]MDF0588364.1 DUF4236 domain-containing protein [Tsukamurella sp. 8F]